MSKRIIFLLLFLCALQVEARRRWVPPAAAGGGGGGLLINETFEGVGTPAGWTTVSGTPNYDNTVSPLAGAEDFKIAASVLVDVTKSFTASNEIWAEIKFTRSSTTNIDEFIYFDAGAQYIVIALNGATPGLILQQAGVNVGSRTTDNFPAATPVWLFVHLLNGTGANAVYEVEFSTTSTRTGSGNKFTSYSSGTVTNQWDVFEPYHAAADSATFQFDDVKVSNTGWPP